MDAQGYLEELSSDPHFHLSACSTGSPISCEPATCRFRCAIEVIDELLAEPGAASGSEVDALLDLRWHLRHRENAELGLRLFSELRLRMESRHYLSFFRLRRWLENHLLADVRACQAAESHRVPVKLDHYCVEALRRSCLCAALGNGAVLLAPRLRFEFRPQTVSPAVVSATAESLDA